MNRFFKRTEILERLDASLASNSPVIAAGPCSGIAAKCAGKGGADLIIYSALGVSRSMGFPTRQIEDFYGDRTMKIHKIFNEVVEDTPLIAGLDASDIFSLDHERLIKRFVDAGASGVSNIPSSQIYGDEFRMGAGATPRHGMHQELHLLAAARDYGLFTVGYAFKAGDALDMVGAGVDVIIATAGHTQGGTAGYPKQSYDDALAKINNIVDAVKEKNSGVLCLGHGGPFNSVESTEVLYERSNVDGFYGGSALDRIPIEAAVTKIVQEYKAPLVGISLN